MAKLENLPPEAFILVPFILALTFVISLAILRGCVSDSFESRLAIEKVKASATCVAK
jgi:hypothetical protein